MTTHVRISDTYAGLVAEATPVSGILTLGTSSKDLDILTGMQAADEFSFELDMLVAENGTADDLACAEFILQAQNSATDPDFKRFIGVLLQPHDPIVPADFEFRGRIMPDMQAPAYDWEGSEFDPDPSPTWKWKCSATSLDVAELVDKKLKGDDEEPGLFDLIDAEWIEENVADELGFFFEDNGPYGDREGRYGDMVLFGTLIQKLLDLAADGSGVAITFDPDVPDFMVAPASVWLLGNNKSEEDAAKTRYGAIVANLSPPPDMAVSPYFSTGSFRALQLDPDPIDPTNHLYISWRLIRGMEKEAEEYGWAKADTLSNLLYALAWNLGMFVVWEYVDNDSITLRFRSRRGLSTTSSALHIPDVTSDSLDVKPAEIDNGRLYGGFANHMASEGINGTFSHDGGYVRSPGFNDLTGDPLLLTISPTICYLHHMGQDAGRKPGEETPVPGALHDDRGGVRMLYNAVFWDSHTGRSSRADSGLHEDHNLIGLHTAMYVRWDAFGFQEEVNGTDGMSCVRPVAAVVSANSDWRINYAETMTDWLDALYGLDDSAFIAERELQVPYLTRFRTSLGGTESWQNCQIASTITLDEREWVVVGIERDFTQGTTKLRLHNASRFAFDEVDTEAEFAPDDPPPSIAVGPSNVTGVVVPTIQSFPAGAAIEQYAAVYVWTDGTVNQAEPDSWSYSRVIGLALDAATEGDVVRVLTDGPLHLDDDYDLTPGWPLVLRKSGHDDAALANLSTVPRRTPTEDEYAHYPLGTVQTPRLITINIGRPLFLKEDVLQVDLSGGAEV